MGIKPALGWLALLLFTTTAQAEPRAELARGVFGTKPVTVVTPKTKAPGPALTAVRGSLAPAGLTVVDVVTKPRADYEADVSSGIGLDTPLAKARGIDRGLVSMVFEHQKRAAFRVGRDRIRRVVRLAVEDRAAPSVVRAGGPAKARHHVDVLDTDDGTIVVEAAVHDGGLFTTSDVYVFPRGMTLDQRVGTLEATAVPMRERIREALVVAEWSR